MDRIIVDFLPAVVKDASDIVTTIRTHILEDIKSAGYYVKVSKDRNTGGDFIEVHKINIVETADILRSLIDTAKEFGITPEQLLAQIEKNK